MTCMQNQITQRSIAPALTGLVALLIINVFTFFLGFEKRNEQMDALLESAQLRESTLSLQHDLTDTNRFLALAADDLFSEKNTAVIAKFVADFRSRLAENGALVQTMRGEDDLALPSETAATLNQVTLLLASWSRVVDNLVPDSDAAFIELVTISDPLATGLVADQLPALYDTAQSAFVESEAAYSRITRITTATMIAVSLISMLAILILVSRILAVYRITDGLRKELESSVLKAQAASVAKSRFLSNMSHELRTPMNGVIGMANLLSSSGLPSKEKHMVGVLKSSADSALMLINDILDVEAIEAGKVTLEQRDFALSDVLTRIDDLANASLVDKDVLYSRTMSPQVSTTLHGDAARLQQIITNLVSNAIKFTSKGAVSLKIDHVPANPVSPVNPNKMDLSVHGYTRFVVEDTGIGIKSDQIEQLFNSFQQADNSIKRRYGGTGLGLAITRSLTHLMGGSISVESQLGKGSRFTVLIPVGKPVTVSQTENRTEDTPTQASSESFSRLASTSVLVVDDNPINLEVAQHLLTEFGCRKVFTACSGEEALQVMQTQDVNVVLMDCHMDGLDGFETTQLILERYDVAVLALTADATKEAEERCKDAGMVGFVTKPFVTDVLRAQLERAAGSASSTEAPLAHSMLRKTKGAASA